MRFYSYFWSLSYFLVYHYAIICSSYSQSPPKLRSDVKNPIVQPIGSTVLLQCPAYDDPSNFIFYEWSRDNQLNDQIEESSRIRLNDNGVLKIKSAVVADSGVYYCKAINGFGYVSTNITLQIVPNDQLQALNSPMDNLYPRDDNDYLMYESNVNFKYNYKKSGKKQSSRDHSKTLELQKPVGVTVRFNCNSRDVRWHKNGAIVHLRHLPIGSKMTRNGMLMLPKVRLEDAGNYSCIGKDGQLNTTFHLYVFDNGNKKPELTGFHPMNRTLYVGDTAMFQCKVSSEAKTHIQWLKNYVSVDKLDANEAINQGLITINNEYYRVLKSSQIKNSGDGIFYNTLLIDKTQISDSGKYICIAANSLGYSYKIAHLIVQPIDQLYHSDAIKTKNIAIFWSIFTSITMAVILLSCILYRKRNRTKHCKQDIVYTPTSINEHNIVTQNHGKQYDSNIKEWLDESSVVNSMRMQKNPAYNCGDITHSSANTARQQLSKA